MKAAKRFFISVFLSMLFLLEVNSQSNLLTLDTVKNYNNWGWEALVIKNAYIKAAIVPDMGGNILQYDFGVDTFLRLEPTTFGQSYEAGSGISPFDNPWGFGGYEIWPSPEAWPPPPNLTYRKFSYLIETSNSDSIVLFLKSEKETETFPGLKYERRIKAYANSTKLKVENTIINMNVKTVNYGMMNVCYVQVRHENLNDYSIFSVSFPINPKSIFKNDGVYFGFSQKSPSYLGQLNPGIYSVEYYPIRGKVFADVKDGWGSFVDKRDNQAYIRVFNVFEGETYPDNGARFEVYISATPDFMAMEVMSPVVNLPANGGSYSFTDNLYSTSLNGTILRASHAGAVMERLKYDSLSNRISGKLGVYSKCQLQFSFHNKDKVLIEKGKSFFAIPDTSVIINETISLPVGTRTIKLDAYSLDSNFIATIDYVDFDEKIITSIISAKSKTESEFQLNGNCFRKNDLIRCELKNTSAENVSIELFDLSGRKRANIFNGKPSQENMSLEFEPNQLSSGIYLLIFSSNTEKVTKKISIIE